jgi:hypothetical protein
MESAAAKASVFIDMAFSSRQIGSIGPELNVIVIGIVQVSAGTIVVGIILLAACLRFSYRSRPRQRKGHPRRSGPKSREETPKKGCEIATPSLPRSAKLGHRSAASNRKTVELLCMVGTSQA